MCLSVASRQPLSYSEPPPTATDAVFYAEHVALPLKIMGIRAGTAAVVARHPPAVTTCSRGHVKA